MCAEVLGRERAAEGEFHGDSRYTVIRTGTQDWVWAGLKEEPCLGCDRLLYSCLPNKPFFSIFTFLCCASDIGLWTRLGNLIWWMSYQQMKLVRDLIRGHLYIVQVYNVLVLVLMLQESPPLNSEISMLGRRPV